jgi:hypothetical protein
MRNDLQELNTKSEELNVSVASPLLVVLTLKNQASACF